MSSPYDIHVLTRAWKFLLLTSLVGAGIAFFYSYAQPWQRSSTARLLVTQNNVVGVDPYTVAKSTQLIADNLAQLVYTSSLRQEILTQANGFDQHYFSSDEYTRRQQWGNAMAAGVTPNTGIIALTVYHPSVDQAHALVDATAQVLTAEASRYFGYNVRVQQIDAPLDSPGIAKPSFKKNSVLGLFVGFVVGMGWVLFRVSRRSRR